MPAEAVFLREALEEAELSVTWVNAVGFQNCPYIGWAETVAWYSVRISVDDLNEWTTTLEAVVDAWPATNDAL